MDKETKEKLIAILSHFETRTNTDILFLMRLAFETGGHEAQVRTYEDWWYNEIMPLLEL